MRKRKRIGIAFLLALTLSFQGLALETTQVDAVRKELASKPYMGWSTFSQQVYNPDVQWVSETELKKQSDAMKEKLSQYGYEYINIDAGWNTDVGDEWGRPQINEALFPSGFKNLTDYIHSNGQKVGLYRIPGIGKNVYKGRVYTKNPNTGQMEDIYFDGSEDRPIYRSKEVYGREIMMSEILAKNEDGMPIDIDYWGYTFKIDFEADGAQLYIDSVIDQMKSWGVDFIKLDSVSPGSGMSDRSVVDEVIAYSKACERNDIWLEVSWAVDRSHADIWKQYANGWRIEWDVEAYESIRDYGENARMVKWENIERLFPKAAQWWDVAGPGGFNDFDSLNVGNGKMNGITEDERRLAVTFWAVSAAQFYIGDDITKLDEYGLSLLTNREVLAVNQAGRPARPVDSSYQVWYANNGDGTYHVGLFNLSKQEKNITVNWSDLGISGEVEVRDLWAGEDLGGFADRFTAKLNSHAAGLYKVTAKNGTSIINNTDSYISYTGDWHEDEGRQKKAATQAVALNVIDATQQGMDGLEPAAAIFLRDMSEEDILVKLKTEAPLLRITNAGQELDAGTDYIQTDSEVRISAAYLSRQTQDRLSLKFEFEFDPENTETTSELVNDNDPAIHYYKNVPGFGYSNGRNDAIYEPNYNINRDVHYSDHADECAIFTFEGTGITFVGETDSSGYADFAVYIDGVRQEGSFTSNLPGGRKCQVELFKRSDLEPGRHTIRIENLSEGRFLNIDGFLVESAPGAEPVVVNDTDPAVEYYRIVTEDWEYSDNREGLAVKPDYGNDIHTSMTAGEYMTYRFKGSGIKFLTEQMNQGAGFEVFLDGQKVQGLFSTDNGGAREGQVTSFAIDKLPFAEHTIKIVNATGGFLNADAFEVLKPKGAESQLTIHLVDPASYELVNNDAQEIQYSGDWRHSTSRGLGDYQDDLHFAEKNGDAAAYTFTGTGVAYLAEKLNEVGQFEVFIDDVSQGIHSAYLAVDGENRQSQQVLYEISGLAYGRHTIKLVKIDGQYLQVDAFRVETPDLVMPNAFIYDKSTPDQEIAIALQGNEDFFLSLTNGGAELMQGRDYDLNNGVIRLSSAYLDTLTAGEYQLQVKFQGDYDNDLHWTEVNGAASSYTFTGVGAELIGPKGPELGSMDIYVDDVKQGSVSAYHEKRLVQQSLYRITDLPRGTHTIKLVKTSGAWMAFDALAIASAQAPAEIPVTGISLNKTSLALTIGNAETLSAAIVPQSATNKAISWTSSDSRIATVDRKTGRVTAIAAGSATVTAASEANPAVTASCSVTVKEPQPVRQKPIEVTQVKLRQSLTLPKGRTTSLGAVVLPANASNTKLTYQSSNKNIAVVDRNGRVKGIKGGTAIITVTAANGKSAKCKLTVAEVKLTASKAKLQIGKTTTAIKIASRYPAKDRVKSFQSSNTRLASVTKNGKILGRRRGFVNIKVTMESGATAVCRLAVRYSQTKTETLTMPGRLTIQKGKITSLNLKKYPITATERLTYTSSNQRVAIVKDGKVKGLTSGQAVITVRSANGKAAKCRVTVPAVKLTAAKAVLQVGRSTTAIRVLSKYPANDRVISYRSANPSIASVSDKGQITARKRGITTIKVTMKSGASAICRLTVQSARVTTKSLSMPKKITLKRGRTISVKVSRNPVTATEKLTYTSSNKNIIAIKNGRLKAIKKGSATITVRSSNGKRASCRITVKN